jgi:hypothetical protein
MKRIMPARGAALGLIALLAGCATLPTGPSVLVLPGSSKTFEAFRADDASCRQYALESVGGKTAAENANQAGATSAAIGTAVGAAAGAAIGGGRGAAVGAGVGLGVGAAAGAGAAETSMYGTQRRYDASYVQCMYASGHRVPVSGRFTDDLRAPAPTARALPPPPPPPPGAPPPPPPGAVAPGPAAPSAGTPAR